MADEQWDRNTAYTQQWKKDFETPAALAALTATDYIEIDGLPPSGRIRGVAVRAETDNQIAPRVRLWFHKTNTAQGATEALSGAGKVPLAGHVELSPMTAHKLNSATQTQEATTSDYVWVSSEECDIPYETESDDGKIYAVVENFGAEPLTELFCDIYVEPKVQGA